MELESASSRASLTHKGKKRRRRNRAVPDRLYGLLTGKPYQSANVEWTHGGTSFLILDQEALCQELHIKSVSLTTELRRLGFSRKGNEWFHSLFQRDRPEKLMDMQIMSRSASSKSMDSSGEESTTKARQSQRTSFPRKLHAVLAHSPTLDEEHVPAARWVDTKTFEINDAAALAERLDITEAELHIQLERYGFQQIKHSDGQSSPKLVYFHRHFVQKQPELVSKLRRQRSRVAKSQSMNQVDEQMHARQQRTANFFLEQFGGTTTTASSSTSKRPRGGAGSTSSGSKTRKRKREVVEQEAEDEEDETDDDNNINNTSNDAADRKHSIDQLLDALEEERVAREDMAKKLKQEAEMRLKLEQHLVRVQQNQQQQHQYLQHQLFLLQQAQAAAAQRTVEAMRGPQRDALDEQMRLFHQQKHPLLYGVPNTNYLDSTESMGHDAKRMRLDTSPQQQESTSPHGQPPSMMGGSLWSSSLMYPWNTMQSAAAAMHQSPYSGGYDTRLAGDSMYQHPDVLAMAQAGAGMQNQQPGTAAQQSGKRREAHARSSRANLETGARQRTELWLDAMNLDELIDVVEADLTQPVRYKVNGQTVAYEPTHWINEEPLYVEDVLRNEHLKAPKQIRGKESTSSSLGKSASAEAMSAGLGDMGGTVGVPLSATPRRVWRHSVSTLNVGKSMDEDGVVGGGGGGGVDAAVHGDQSSTNAMWMDVEPVSSGDNSAAAAAEWRRKRSMGKSVTEASVGRMVLDDTLKRKDSMEQMNAALEEVHQRRRMRNSDLMERELSRFPSLRSVSEPPAVAVARQVMAKSGGQAQHQDGTASSPHTQQQVRGELAVRRSISSSGEPPKLRVLCVRQMARHIQDLVEADNFHTLMDKLPADLCNTILSTAFVLGNVNTHVLEMIVQHLTTLRILGRPVGHASRFQVDDNVRDIIATHGAKLTSLRLIGAPITSFDCLGGLADLTELDLSHSHEMAALKLNTCSKLKRLVLTRCFNLDWEQLSGALVDCPQLSELLFGMGTKLKQFVLVNSSSTSSSSSASSNSSSSGVAAPRLRKVDISLQSSLRTVALNSKHLEAINLQACSQLSKLRVRGCTNLHVMRLAQCTSLSSDSIAQCMQGMPNLRSFDVSSCEHLDDEVLVQLANHCPNLQRLNCSNCPFVSDRGIIAVALRCHNLSYINMGSCQAITEGSIYQISQSCANLRTLILHKCDQLDGESIVDVGVNCKRLAELDVSEIRSLSDKHMQAFVRAAGDHLVKLNVSHCTSIGRHTASALNMYSANSIQVINMSHCVKINDDALRMLALCQRLMHVDFSRCVEISDEGVIPLLERCTKLQALSLYKCSRITNESIQALVSCNNGCLRSLDLGSCENVSDEALVPLIATCHSLRDLDFEGCQITDRTLVQLAAHCRELHALKLAWCKHVTAASIHQLSMRCKQIVSLDLSWTRSVDFKSQAMRMALSNFVQLQRLNLTGVADLNNVYIANPFLVDVNLSWCNKLNLATIAELAEGCPSLESVSVAWSSVDTDMLKLLLNTLSHLKAIDITGVENLDPSVYDLAKRHRVKLLGSHSA